MEPFNKLSPAEAERLAILMGECAEVIHIIGKIQQHGYESRYPADGKSNRELLEMELGDIECAKRMMAIANDIKGAAILAAYIEKQGKIGKWLHHNVPPPI